MGILDILAYFVNPQFIFFVFLGSLTGLLVGAIPGLSVTMATALLVSVTYTWNTSNAMAMIMGVYVVGVFFVGFGGGVGLLVFVGGGA